MKFERNTCITQQLTWNMCSVTVKISVRVCSKTVHPTVNGNQRICVQLASFSMLQLDNTRAMDKYCQCFHSPCFSHAFPMLCYMYGRRTHTHTHYCTNSSPRHIVLYNTIKAQPVVFCWFLQFDTYMLHSVAVMARAIVSAVYVYFCRLVNSMLFCDFTAAVFSWDDSSTGDRDADSRHLTNRLPGLPFPIPGPAQPRERCQCAAGPGSLH